jgi:hypothetical protein
MNISALTKHCGSCHGRVCRSKVKCFIVVWWMADLVDSDCANLVMRARNLHIRSRNVSVSCADAQLHFCSLKVIDLI